MQMPTDVQISSHRPLVGPFIVLYKKIVGLIVGPYLHTVFEREHELIDERVQAINDRIKASALQVEALAEAVRTQGLRQRAHEERVSAIHDQVAEARQTLEEQLARAEADSSSLLRETISAYTQDILKRTDTIMIALDKRIELAGQLKQYTDEQIQAQHRDLVAIANAMNRHRLELEQMMAGCGRDLRTGLNDVSLDLTLQKRRLDLVLTELRSQITPSSESLAKIASQRERLLDHAYFLFENRFRGASELIRKRQEVYLPTFAKTQASLGGRFSHVLDVGCGRGEFLELLQQHGIPARGIDLNEDMVLTCQKKGLAVEHAEALAYLEAVPNDSLSGIISCQLIEHFEIEVLLEFVKLCYDKTCRGATVVFETVNPESVVTMRNFYLDLSHKKPIPPQAISFVLEAVGFAKPDITYLAPFSPDDMLDSAGDKNLDKLNALLFGYQDYAVIASK